MDATTCKAMGCQYNSVGFCALNVKGAGDIVGEQCLPTDNWHIVGSFVLDRIFGKNSAKDIDLVIPKGEMPAKLPDEVVQSALPIEMVWRSPGDTRVFEFYNISLPKISPQGVQNWEAAEDLRKTMAISTLPRIRKVPATTVFIAIKSIVKYDLRVDDKTSRVWARSILEPAGWKKEMRWLIPITGEPVWDYLRAEYLIGWLERAYRKNGESEKLQYLQRLREVLQEMELKGDIAYELLSRYINASIDGNVKEMKELKEMIRTLSFPELQSYR